MSDESNVKETAVVAGAARGSEWTSWPTHTGQQFVSLAKEIWVGSVDVGYTDAEHGTKLTIWKGGAIYTVWSNHPHGFHFQQIAWPSMPNDPSSATPLRGPVSAPDVLERSEDVARGSSGARG